MFKLTCLMTSSVSLSDRMSEVLFDTACVMLRDGVKRKFIRDSGVIEGMVSTSFKAVALVGSAGTEFTAEVETELGRGTVRFIVREQDADRRNRGLWVPFFSLTDLNGFIDGLEGACGEAGKRPAYAAAN